MRKSIKKLLAVIFAITMILGVVPIKSEIVEAAPTYDNTIFYTTEFAGERSSMVADVNQFIRSQYGVSVKTNTNLINICQNKLVFTNSWNGMKDNQTVVVINSHGSPTQLCGLSTADIKKLNYKHIGCIVILGCNIGHYDYRTENVARAFADRFHCPVIACDGTVSFYNDGTSSNPHYVYKPSNGVTWNNYCRGKYSGRAGHACYGWLAYFPKYQSDGHYVQGRLYQIAPYGGRMSLYEMLANYYRGNVRELPAR